MKKFEEIHKSLSYDSYKSPKILDYHQSELVERAAKEYAKQWVVIAVALAGIDRTVNKNEETIQLIQHKIDCQ